jgi:hypothetical protein
MQQLSFWHGLVQLEIRTCIPTKAVIGLQVYENATENSYAWPEVKLFSDYI